MAIPWAIAARRGQAINRLTATAQAISDKYDIDELPPVVVPKIGQDPAISQMVQIEAFAAWLDALADKLGVGEQTAEEAKPAVKPASKPAVKA